MSVIHNEPAAIIAPAVDEFVAAINELEAQADAAETQPSDIRWEQARQVAAAHDAGMTTRQIASGWHKSDGTSVSQSHVMNTLKTWRIFEHYSVQDRPLFYTAYNSTEVRGKSADPKDPADRDSADELGGDEWYTPRWLFDALEITFDIDTCSPQDRTHASVPAKRWYTIEDDGLAQPWSGIVWCNPPYSTPNDWAMKMIAHGNGLLLTHIPMNAGWAAEVWRAADGIRLFQAMEFVRPDGAKQRPGYWLMLAAFGPRAADALAHLEVPDEVADNPRRVPSPMWVRA
jgi:phage N-6-adenine-methyltransferase